MGSIIVYISYFMVFTSIAKSCLSASISINCTSGTNCVLATSCYTVIRLVEQQRHNKVKEMFCDFEGTYPKVCCPLKETIIEFRNNESPTKYSNSDSNESNKVTYPINSPTTYPYEVQSTKANSAPTDPFPNKTICGQDRLSDKIVGGLIADIDEFPWLGRILYKNSRSKNGKSYLCGASLITDRFLVTAAHCLIRNRIETAISVRLGEWDDETELDCDDNHCADKPVDIEIEKIFLYDKNYKIGDYTGADIALIKLKKPVKFTEYISPICLPSTEYVQMQEYAQDVPYWTAGWGITEFGMPSVLKRKISLKGVSSEGCQQRYKQFEKSFFDRVICAGGMEGRDSCRGDSGGPLMKSVEEDYQSNWYLFGITSIGSYECGKEGTPGIYTKSSIYLDWIRYIVSTN